MVKKYNSRAMKETVNLFVVSINVIHVHFLGEWMKTELIYRQLPYNSSLSWPSISK
jgi:hypothetical protein